MTDFIIEHLDAILAGIVAIIVAAISGYISYRTAIAKSKKDAETLISEHELTVKQEEQLLLFKEEVLAYKNLSEALSGALIENYKLFPKIGVSYDDPEEEKVENKRLYNEAAGAYNKA